jgi:hypothetical protein
MLWVSAAVFPTLEKNLTQILCSFTDSILHMTTGSITKPVTKTKPNIQYTWSKSQWSGCKVNQTTPNVTDALLIYGQISGTF